MANEEVLGPRKTMFVIVIVVGCFAVLWPRILSPLIVGNSKEQLKPNQYDRDAGCCEVLFETEVAVLELLNEVCSSAVGPDGKLSPYSAAECRKAVNETCGMDIQVFLKRTDNVGKTTKVLLETMKASNSSCLKEHFGVPVWNLGHHSAWNSWLLEDTVKQERSIRTGPHPALRERGRAIPPAPGTPAPRPAPLPPHLRVRSSPLQGYFEIDIKPPPIPGMRPPLGAPGGPVQAPKSSMGFVMPIYTICIIVFFVYTLSKILFKRTATPYDPVSADPQFRRRVFRDESRTSPDKLVVAAISGLVAEVQQQMEASYAQNQQRQEPQDNHARPYTNGTIIHSGPVQIVATEYRDPSKERSLEPVKEASPDPKEAIPEPVERIETKEGTEPEDTNVENGNKESSPEPKEIKEASPEPKELTPEARELTPELKELTPEPITTPEESDDDIIEAILAQENRQSDNDENNHTIEELKKITDNIENLKDSVVKLTEDFLNKEKTKEEGSKEEKKSTPELLEEALKEDSPSRDEPENATVKVVGMETRAHAADGGAWPLRPAPRAPAPRAPHEAEQVSAIYLDTEIPQQSRVLVADFADQADPAPAKHSPLVVSGKMTLSLIQDTPRDTPERDLESTMDDFTTASAFTQPAAEKDGELSEEEIEEEIEVEEIEEEVEVEEEEEDEEPKKVENTEK